MARPHRLLFTLVLSLLLVGSQLASGLHALQHVREALKQSPDHSLSVPGDEVCAMCALFAGSASAVTGEIGCGYDALAADETPRFASVWIAQAAPSYYQSRAPPSLL
jgi:hypothetical protein